MIKINFYITARESLVREVFDESNLLISLAPSSPILLFYLIIKYNKKMSIKYSEYTIKIIFILPRDRV